MKHCATSTLADRSSCSGDFSDLPFSWNEGERRSTKEPGARSRRGYEQVKMLLYPVLYAHDSVGRLIACATRV